MLKNKFFLKIAGFCGIIMPIMTFSLIFLAIFYAPWFSWTENALSDLGVEGISAILFNNGLIIGGIMSGIFALGLIQVYNTSIQSRVGTILFLFTAFALCAIGLFPETMGRLHMYVSIAFFVLLPMSLFFMGWSMLKKSETKKNGVFSLLTAIIAIGIWVLPWTSVAIPEAISSLAASSFSIIYGFKLYQKFK